ncbi:VanZ family protein [Microbacterium sp. 1P10UB]|uniref:VanZ family protein n=1 Tax=unclassified Microbacterium TaxID=2609290 RepID=UPI0039A31400
MLASIVDRFGIVIGVTVLVGVPLGITVAIILARRRVAAGWPRVWAQRSALAEVGMVVGTVPWVWMIMTPTGGAGGVRLVPFRDLANVIAGGDAIVQLIGNLLVFSAIGFLLPIRFRLGSTWTVVPEVVILAAILSATLEVLQLVLSLGRVTSLDDVLINTFGAAIASLISLPWWRARIERFPEANPTNDRSA